MSLLAVCHTGLGAASPTAAVGPHCHYKHQEAGGEIEGHGKQEADLENGPEKRRYGRIEKRDRMDVQQFATSDPFYLTCQPISG